MKHKKNSNFIKPVLILFLSILLSCLVYSRIVFQPSAQLKNQAQPATEKTVNPAEETEKASLSLSPSAEETSSPEIAELQTSLRNYISTLNGSWSVCFEKLSTGETVSYAHSTTEDTPMVSASLIRLWIMGETYQQIADGTLKENSVSENLVKMITVSDNDATNALINMLGGGSSAKGMTAVNAFAADCGCSATQLNRLMLANNGKQNYTTANDCAKLLSLIYNGKCVSASASDKMLTLLSAQSRKNKIPAGLPDGVKCANETGDLTGFCEGDAAIVFVPDKNYILCVIVTPKDNAAAISQIKKVSQLVYNCVAAAK